MKANKIKLNGEILLDLTKDTATEADVAEGKTFHKADGTPATGTATVGGGGSMEGFHKVRFFNDDRTTILYTVFIPHGASAIYAGETPASTLGIPLFKGFEPSATNVTADLDCYAVYELDVGTLNETSWENIDLLSRLGTAQNYFAVGDTKMIHIEGTVGIAAVNGDYGVYIIGFDHNEEIEGKGVHFGTFKSTASNGIDLCLDANSDGNSHTDGTKWFNMNHWGNSNYGGWAGCDLRYDIIGSTDVAPSGYGAKTVSGRTGYDATQTCATNPVANTLMAALPSDLRAVIKPMTKYSNNIGGKGDDQEKVTVSTDYLPLLAEFEVFGARNIANSYEQKKQKQYDYFAEGNSKKKYKHFATSSAQFWWFRSARYTNDGGFCCANKDGVSWDNVTYFSFGIAPIFKV